MKRVVGFSIAAVVLMAAGYAAGQQQAPPQVHRVVTGINSEGKAVALFDGAVPLQSLRSPNPAGDMWVTQAYPADFNWLARPPLSRILSDSTLTAPMLVVSLHRGETHHIASLSWASLDPIDGPSHRAGLRSCGMKPMLRPPSRRNAWPNTKDPPGWT